MGFGLKVILFSLVSAGIIWVSRPVLRDPQSHGFYRFLAWEVMLILFLINVDFWFYEPFSIHQILSWILLILSLVLVIWGIQLLREQGRVDDEREDPNLVWIEKTTALVTIGIYRYIRHPFYSSLLFLGWGIFLKQVTWTGIVLVSVISILLFITARKEEVENTGFFGEAYQEYMKQTKMFIPFIF
ncbi:MAG: isoprenylcysteine carboxylmethyltransferase family protein [Chloroflexota bacterium]